jgi:hypothetical protein
VNQYRLSLGGLPVNIFDLLMILGCVAALLRPRSSTRFIRTERIHPVVWWSFILFGLAFVGGLIGATYNGAAPRHIITAIRNFIAAPMALYLAYFLTGTFKSSRQYLYWLVLAGLGASFMIMVFFTGKAESRMPGQDVTSIRAVAYVSAYAGLAACLLFYSMAAGMRLFVTVVGLVLLGICLIGQCGTLSRSDWLALTSGVIATLLILPKEARVRSLVRVAVAVPIIAVSLYAGLYGASRVTGRDMFDRMQTRLLSMLPGYNPGENNKAWSTRLPGTFRELRKFVTTPIIGGGFAIDDTAEMEGTLYSGLRHNTWTSTLAETGLLGFAAFATMTFGMGFAGWRMVRDRLDKTTVLIGAMGFVTCIYYFIYGNSTMTFNQVRWGIPLFVMAGVVLRTRAMQLECKRQMAADQDLIEQFGSAAVAIAADPTLFAIGEEQPLFGNWYQPS